MVVDGVMARDKGAISSLIVEDELRDCPARPAARLHRLTLAWLHGPPAFDDEDQSHDSLSHTAEDD